MQFSMSGPGQKRRTWLTVVIAGALLGVLIGLAPTLRNQTQGDARPLTPVGPTGVAAVPAWGASTGAFEPAVGVAAESPESARQLEQLALLRDALVEREREVGLREAALRRALLSGFWMRQAVAIALTLMLAIGAVLLALRLGLGERILEQRMGRERSRLQKLQLSVIGALENLEAMIASAQQVAPAVPAARGTTTRAARAEGARQSLPRETRRVPARSWMERLVDPEVSATEAELPTAAVPEREGPWRDPARRTLPAPDSPAPRWRAQVEYLAAEGLNESEIATRLRVSREEVRLVLACGARHSVRESAHSVNHHALPIEVRTDGAYQARVAVRDDGERSVAAPRRIRRTDLAG